jgi:hypothetical protein
VSLTVFLPLFEALNWAVALDDLARSGPRTAKTLGLQGLRQLRDRDSNRGQPLAAIPLLEPNMAPLQG